MRYFVTALRTIIAICFIAALVAVIVTATDGGIWQLIVSAVVLVVGAACALPAAAKLKADGGRPGLGMLGLVVIAVASLVTLVVLWDLLLPLWVYVVWQALALPLLANRPTHWLEKGMFWISQAAGLVIVVFAVFSALSGDLIGQRSSWAALGVIWLGGTLFLYAGMIPLFVTMGMGAWRAMRDAGGDAVHQIANPDLVGAEGFSATSAEPAEVSLGSADDHADLIDDDDDPDAAYAAAI